MKNRLSVWQKQDDFFERPYSVFLPPEVKKIPQKFTSLLTMGKVELGRWLFYDSILSADKTISCASCHKPELGFTDSLPKSVGIKGQKSDKKSMALHNLAWSQRFFWNGRSESLEDAVWQPILNEKEMGSSVDTVLDRLNRHDGYRKMFRVAFGKDDISRNTVSQALTAFLVSLVSFNSPLDQIKRVDMNFWSIKDLESEELKSGRMNNMKNEFVQIQSQCGSCHEPAMNGISLFENIGLDKIDNGGLGKVTHKEEDTGKYKTPSLRNIVSGIPMMHDGRFNLLSEVLDHYEQGIQEHRNLSVRLKDGQGKPGSIALSHSGRKGTEYFISLLIDQDFLQNPVFADPFSGNSVFLLNKSAESGNLDSVDAQSRARVLSIYKKISTTTGNLSRTLDSLIDNDYRETTGTQKKELIKKFEKFSQENQGAQWIIFPTVIHMLKSGDIETLHIAMVKHSQKKIKLQYIPERIQWIKRNDTWKIISWEHI